MASQRHSMAGRIGAHTKWANTTNRTEATAAARKAAAERWLKHVDPDGVLPEAERIQRAESAKKAWMLRLAMASAKARANKGTRRRKAA